MSESKFPATRLIVIANLAVFAAMCVVSGGKAISAPSSEMLLHWGANFGPRTLNGEWWRMFSSMFLHIGFVHIAFNMAALWNLGQSAEELFGTRRFVNLYFISGFGGSCLSLLFNPGVVSAGASGAIFGVYGSLFAFFFAHRKEMGKEAFLAGSKSATAFLVLNIVLGFTFGFDNFCHLGGLVSGFLCGTFYLPRGNKPLSRHPVLGTFLLIASIYGLFKYAQTIPFDLGDRYYVLAARELMQSDRYAEASELLNKALVRKPNNADAIFLRGFALLKTKHYQEALADFEKAAAIDPELTEAVKLRDALKAEFVPAKKTDSK
ncbi:MAG: rhomboid protease GluP [Cyanobacteriota bacterium erpe_2018_sw_21hr_WHONDRS-SW48-000092_B_bin.40]|nr:rhomboid protease GluP [Cyanobacteriota bacterium erpe_2018_sw_21hr_WHONDRS-SW48-000092_B_bin.40]